MNRKKHENREATNLILRSSPLAQRKRPKIVATIPCFNTEYSITAVVSRTKKYVDQVIVIDDGSSDNTDKTAQAAGASVVKHDGNRGYGEAIKDCFKAAKADTADILVTIDGDGQHQPDEIPQLLAPILRGEADVIIGSRFLRGQESMPLYRKFGIKAITLLYNLGSKVKVSDSQSGFRAYNQNVLKSLSLTEKGMSISIETLVEARRKGFVIKEVPISCTYDAGSHNLNPVIHGLGIALKVVKLRLVDRLRRRSHFSESS